MCLIHSVTRCSGTKEGTIIKTHSVALYSQIEIQQSLDRCSEMCCFTLVSNSSMAPLEQIRVKCLSQAHTDTCFTLPSKGIQTRDLTVAGPTALTTRLPSARNTYCRLQAFIKSALTVHAYPKWTKRIKKAVLEFMLQGTLDSAANGT